MILRNFDDLAIGEHAPHLAGEALPLDRPVKIVEHRRAAPKQELAQNRHVALEQSQRARLDEIDPWVLKETRIVEREDNRVLDLNRGRGLHTPGEVLIGRGRVDEPRLSFEVLRDLRPFRVEVVPDSNEPPLEAGMAIAGRVRTLGIDGRLQRGRQDEQHQRRDGRDNAARTLRRAAGDHGRASTSLSSSSWAGG